MCFISSLACPALTPGGKQLLGEWAQAVLQTPQIFRRLAFRRRTLEEELQEVRLRRLQLPPPPTAAATRRCQPLLQAPVQAALRGSLRKAFNGFALLCLGLGIVIAR